MDVIEEIYSARYSSDTRQLKNDIMKKTKNSQKAKKFDI